MPRKVVAAFTVVQYAVLGGMIWFKGCPIGVLFPVTGLRLLNLTKKQQARCPLQTDTSTFALTADNCRNGRVGFGRMRAGAIFGCHRNPNLERQILTRVGFEPELGFIDSG